MNILVIGNGFDLVHGLPTKYTDFLEFVKMIKIIKEKDIFDDGVSIGSAVCNVGVVKLHQDIRLIIFNKANNKELKRDSKELIDYIDNNFWIDYFLQCDMHGNENWIDFESEISEVIKSLDNDMHKLSSEYSIDDDIMDLSNKYLYNIYSDYTFTTRSVNSVTGGSCESITFRKIRNRLLGDLNRLIRAFEIYLTEYVEKIDCKLVSPDIRGIIPKESMKYTNELYVLSFNYTNTYQRIYNKVHVQMYAKSNIDYIHGKADINNTIKSNNMVLGIDEYLPKKRRNKETEFIAFKKFYQRIHKQTGCEYRKWIKQIIQNNKTYKEEVRLQQLDYERNRGMGNEGYQTRMNLKKLEENPPKHNLYFFGHSLDITDKDILRELILTESVHTTIFYVNEDVMGQQIANLVKVIGQDELIRRTGEKTIEFKPQQKMEPIDK